MNKCVMIKDIKDALIELVRSKKWLERKTTMNIINALVNLPIIDIVYCNECIWRDKDNQGENYCTYVKGLADINGESFCSYGERKEE